MYVYAKVLQDMVEREKKGTDFFCSETDRIILSAMCEEINAALGSNWHYLAEFVCCDICGSGEIISKYIEKFETEGIKAMLFPQKVSVVSPYIAIQLGPPFKVSARSSQVVQLLGLFGCVHSCVTSREAELQQSTNSS